MSFESSAEAYGNRVRTLKKEDGLEYTRDHFEQDRSHFSFVPRIRNEKINQWLEDLGDVKDNRNLSDEPVDISVLCLSESDRP